MEHKASDIIGLPVYAINDGEKIGQVRDVIYDHQVNRVLALLLDEGGWFKDARVLPTKSIKNIGRDAVMTDTADNITTASDFNQKVARITQESNYLTQRRIVTEEGTDLGRVDDILFSLPEGKVNEFEVSQGAIKNIGSGKKRVKTADIVTIGEDVTIVKAYTEIMLEDQGEHQGLQGAVKDISQKSSSTAQKAGERVSSAALAAKAKINQKLSDPQTRAAVSNIKSKLSETREYMENKKEQVKSTMQREAETAKPELKEQSSKAGSKISQGVRRIRDAFTPPAARPQPATVNVYVQPQPLRRRGSLGGKSAKPEKERKTHQAKPRQKRSVKPRVV